jgi:hypothetical protein
MNAIQNSRASSLSPWVLAAWTSFLSASLLEAVVFALVDPGEIHWIGHLVLPSRQSVYTVAFFLFWMQGMLCASLTLWLTRTVKT